VAEINQAMNSSPSSSNQPSQQFIGLLDCAELYIIEKVRARVRRQVEETLLNEFSGLIQAETEKALAGICFNLAAEKDFLTHSDRLQILITWAKAKEGKKHFRTETTIVEAFQ